MVYAQALSNGDVVAAQVVFQNEVGVNKMPDAERQILDLLDANGFELIRQHKHRVFRNAEGRIFVVPKTPSDHHSYRNNLHQLKRTLSSPTPEIVTPTFVDDEPESTPEQQTKEIRERAIGLTPERYARRYPQQFRIEATQQTEPKERRVELIDMYTVGAVLRRALGMIVSGFKPEVEEYYRAMAKLHDLIPFEDLDPARLARVERRVQTHCDHLDQTVLATVRTLQNVVRKVRRREHCTYSQTRTELTKLYMKIFDGDPLLTTNDQDERERYCRFLAKHFLGEKKLIAAVCYGIEFKWHDDRLEFRTISNASGK